MTTKYCEGGRIVSTLQEFQQGLTNAWHAMEDGWRAIVARAGTALTRFHWLESAEDEENDRTRIGWGLLAADVELRDHEVVIDVEIPGMDSDDFTVSVRDGALVVHGEKKLERERSEGDLHVVERAYGSFERAIPLPVPVDDSGANASYNRGVLQVTLPRVAESSKSQIEVKTIPG